MMRSFGALTIATLLLFSIVVGTAPANLAFANPIPPPEEKIEITSPKNASTYYTDKILLSINVTTTYSCTLFYSLDGQPMKPVENITVNSKVDINAGKNPQIYRLVLNASAWVSVPLGTHEITVYHINPNTEQKVGQADVVFYTAVSASSIPEFPSWTLLPLIFSIALFSIIVKRKLGKAKVS